MGIKRALVAGAAGLGTVMAVGVAAPAEASPRMPVSCTYTVDESAGTFAGSCSGRLTASFSGTYSGDTAAGEFSVDTRLGDIDGSFTASGLADGGAVTVTYTVTTWFRTFTGTIGARPA